MNVKKKSWRVLGLIGAILLSIPLVAALAITPLYSAASSVITPEALTSVIQNVDYSAMLAGNPTLEDVEGNENLPEEMMEALITSDFVEEVLTTYTREVITAIQGDEVSDALSKEHILDLTEEHMDELLALANTYIPDAEKVTEQEMRTHIRGTMEELSTELLKTLPSSQEVQAMMPGGDAFNPITLLVNPTIPWVLFGATVVLAALVFLCLIHRYRGLLCLGIDGLIALVPLLSVYSLLLEGGYLHGELMAGENAAIAAPLLDTLTQNLLIGIVVVGVLALALIGWYVVRLTRQKKQAVEEPGEEFLEKDE